MDLDFTQAAALASILGVVFAIVSGGLRFLQDYLTAKLGPRQMSTADQSAQCRFDHEILGRKMAEQQDKTQALIQHQNEHIAQLLQQNGEQLKYMQEASHVNELRHTITIQKLDALLERVGI